MLYTEKGTSEYFILLQNFESKLEKSAPELKNDSRYNELKNLIKSIQTKIYGVNL
jgi:hypothetical protein